MLWAQAQPSFDEITIVDANIFPSDAVVDASGNTYVIGTFSGDPDFDPGAGVVNAPDLGNWKSEDSYNDAFLVKYNNDGTLAWIQAMWTRGATGAGNDPFIYFRDITLDDSDNVFFVGDIRGVANGIGNQVTGASTIGGGDSPRAFVRGLSSTGSIIFQGINTHTNLSAGSTGHGIDVDATDNVYITGEFDYDVNGFTVANPSNKQTYYTKFSSSGTRIEEGYLINSATSTYDVNRDNGGRSIAVQDNGSFLVTGYFGQNAAFDGSTTLSSVNQKDTYVAYYNSSEALLDVKTFSTAEEGRQVELDADGNLYLSYGTNFTRITNAGVTDWTRDFGYDVAFSINASNELLVTRLSDELRYLKMLSNNTIEFEIAVPFISGVTTELSSIKAFEFVADDYKWILSDLQSSNFDCSAPYESGSGIIMANYSTQTDFTAPAIQSRTPGLNATNVPLEQVFTVEFDEDIVLESGQGIVSIAPTAGGGITNLFEGNPGLSASGNTLTFSTSNLIASTTYQITLLNIQDDLGNEIPTTNGWFITTGTTATDETPPTIVSLTPSDNAADVSINSIFTVEFNEPIALPENNQAIIVYRNSSPFYIMAHDDSRLSISSSTLSIDLGTLESSTPYYVWLKGVTDIAENYYVENNITGTWNFTTVSPQSPFVITFSTTDGTFDFPVQLTDNEFSLEWTNLTNPGNNEGSAIGLTDDYEITGLSNGDTYRLEAGGTIARPQFNLVSGNVTKVLSLEQWGDIEWASLERTFESCVNMQYNASDAPDLTSVTSLRNLFSNATMVDGDFSSWDVSGVQNFDATFNNTALSSDLSTWDISSATNVQFMIYQTDMDYEAYDATLTAWSNLTLPRDLSFIPRNLEYCQATAARQKIIDNFDWMISQDIERCRIYWDGSEWDISTGPQSYNEVFVEGGDYTFSTDGAFDICENLTISTGNRLTIDNGGILEVTGDVSASNGDITVASGASLIMLGNYSGSGDVTAERSVTGNGGLSMVGSPIQSMNVGNQGADYIFKFNESTQQYESVSSETMAGGEGYFIGYDAASPTLSFSGTPFTGDVTVSIPAGGYKMIANPYLGPIGHDSYNFDAAPGVTDGNIWLWDDGGNNDGGSRGGDYITVNSMGTASGGSGASGNTYEGFIPSFQAFFVKGDSDGGDITFTTSMMTTSAVNTDDHHFRVDESQIQKIKLSLEGEGYYNELIVGFTQEATEEDDFGLDAQKLESSNGFAFFSVRDEKKYAIQAFPPLEDKREVSLGMNLPIEGAFEINVNELVGFDSYILIELNDNETGLVYDLNEAETVRLNAGKGVIEERFQLRFSNLNAVLSAKESAIGFEITGLSNDRIMMSHPDEQVAWKIMDASGKLLYEDTMDALDHQFNLPFSVEKDKLYILQGNTTSIKLIIQ